MKAKIYSLNDAGKMILVRAYSKKQIREKLNFSKSELTKYCSRTNRPEDTIVDKDLTTIHNKEKNQVV